MVQAGPVYGHGFPELPTGQRFNNLTGLKFGRLTVLSYGGNRPSAKSNTVWFCRCDCGAYSAVDSHHLTSGATFSCGCYARERLKKRSQDRSHDLRSAGLCRRLNPLYQTWIGMKNRCLNANYKQYYLYGGRGIRVCARWLESFEAFTADIGQKPSPRHTLDRIDNDGPYSPMNCRWATPQQQARNRRGLRMIEYRGQVKCVGEWSDQLGIACATIIRRVDKGWPVERALSTRVRPWAQKPNQPATV